MSAIKLHLESEELAAVERLAQTLHVSAEDIAFCALNRLMLQCKDTSIRMEIQETPLIRGRDLALWSDTARSVHAYEGKHDDQPEQSRYV